MTDRNDRYQRVARLVVPRMQGDRLETDFETFRGMVREGFRAFIVFGARANTLREALRELERDAAEPLLILSDLEQGTGQQVSGGASIPAAMALAHAVDRNRPEDAAVFRRLMNLVAADARRAGVNVILAPVADLHINPKNPIICTRAYGSDPDEVSWFVREQILAFQRNPMGEPVLACAKHFPGHGRTSADSHLGLPVIPEDLEELSRTDLRPFRSAIEAGCGMIMVGHLLMTALDGENPASRSHRIVEGLLRRELGFQGLVITDAMNMAGAHAEETETDACVASIRSGCDVILHPSDARLAAESLALRESDLEPRINAALGRVRECREALFGSPAGVGTDSPRLSDSEIRDEIHSLVDRLSRNSILVEKGTGRIDEKFLLVVLDEDEQPAHGETLHAVLRQSFPAVSLWRPAQSGEIDQDRFRNRSVVVALYSRIAAWKGRSGLSPGREAMLQRVVRESARSIVVSFGCPSLLGSAPDADVRIHAWWASSASERAIGDYLCGKSF